MTARDHARPLLSVVVPCNNEEAMLPQFFREVIPALQALDADWEMLCVDDGSRDATLQRLLEQARGEPRLQVIKLSRNFGKEAAMSAGLDLSAGQVAVVLDADLQDPPELIAPMLAKWREGFDVVYAVRRSRDDDSLARRIGAHAFYRVFNRLTTEAERIPADTGDFRLLDRRVVERLRELPERTRFMKGLFAWLGFSSAAIPYDRPPRARGHSAWSYWKLWNFALDGLTSFSTMPLRVWTYVGLSVSLLSFVYATFLVLRTLIHGVDLPGYASLMVVILFLGGILLISMGVIGEYLGRVFVEVKQRPLYLVEQVYQFSTPDNARP